MYTSILSLTISTLTLNQVVLNSEISEWDGIYELRTEIYRYIAGSIRDVPRFQEMKV